MSISALIADYLEFLEVEKGATFRTIRNYNHWLNKFSEFVGEIEPKSFDLKLLEKYRKFLSRWKDPKGYGFKKVTQNLFLIALRGFLRYLKAQNITSLEAQQVLLGNQTRRSLDILRLDKINLILNSPNMLKKGGIRDKAILELLYCSGLKVSELTSLNRDQIEEVVQLKIEGAGRIREMNLSEKALEAVKRYLAVRKDRFKPLFIRFQGKASIANEGEAMRLTPRSIERIVQKYVKLSGIQANVTPKSFRHNFALDKLISGADIKSLQAMLGHANSSTTQIYSQQLPKEN